MKYSIGNENYRFKSLVIAPIAAILLLLGVFTNIEKTIEVVNPVITPFSLYGIETGEKARLKLKNFFSKDVSVEEVNSLKEKIEQLEIVSRDYENLKEKYDSLKTHSKTAEVKYSYIQANFYNPLDGGEIILNSGTKSGVEVGDIVVVGNIYAGTVISVEGTTSKILPPYFAGNTFSVAIRHKSKNALTKAVAVGKDFEIVLENIPNSSFIQNGDNVYISDPKIGSDLLLGSVYGLKKDQASPVVEAKVDMALEISNIKYLFIRK